jgi:hypothetical protein
MRVKMLGNFDAVQKLSTTNLEATTKVFGTLSKTTQAISAEMADYSKRSYENGAKAMEKLFSVKSLDKAIEVQSEYAKSFFEDYSAQLTKLGQLYAELTKDAFKPFETQMAKTLPAK